MCSVTDGKSLLEGSRQVAQQPARTQTNDLEEGLILEKLGLWLHKLLLILICCGCQVGLRSNTILGHLKNQHNCQVMVEDRGALIVLCASWGVHQKPEDIQVP